MTATKIPASNVNFGRGTKIRGSGDLVYGHNTGYKAESSTKQESPIWTCGSSKKTTHFRLSGFQYVLSHNSVNHVVCYDAAYVI